jgi:phage baseplate assembly protein W
MAIKLNIIKPSVEVEQTLKTGFLYKDVLFDIKLNYTNNPELFKTSEKKDLQPIYDYACIVTALKNIFTTSPGEKHLNPTFGLDLRDYLFEPVSETRAFFIGQDIFDGLTVQEPRVSVERITVIGIIDEQTYEIDLNISVPSLNINNLSLKGVLNNDGFTFI